ncbi:MAG: DUF4178 domain-containing protein [Chloroflexi bacterium]|nr:DUF4178 domain-containing protein [Chloroflexota bacterium]
MGTRALGWGLIALGAALGAAILLWLATTLATGDLEAGGFALGLIPVVLFVLPLVGAGWYFLSRAQVEVGETADFERRQRIFEADKLFSERLRDELTRQARRLDGAAPRALPSGSRATVARVRTRLDDLAEVVGASYDESAWYGSVRLQLDDEAMLRRYDDLLLESTRRLDREIDGLSGASAAGTAAAAVSVLEAAVTNIQTQLQQREDLLWRGQRPPEVAPLERLRLSASRHHGLGALGELAVGDAVTYEQTDYLVEARLTYFSQGQSWFTFLLRDGGERWLRVVPATSALALLVPTTETPAGTPETFQLAGTLYRRVEFGTASVTLQTSSSTDAGIVVDYASYRSSSGHEVALLERWPDGARAFLGIEIFADEVEVWSRRRAESLKEE